MVRHRRMSTEIVGLQVLVVLATLVVGFGLTVALLHRNLVHQYEERVLAIAHAVAADPEIAAGVVHDRPGGGVQRRAERVRRETGALFVVVTDDRGIRWSHPNTSRIGRMVSTDPSQALAGHPVVAVERGTLGLSARAKVPLRDASGHVVGEVSVGIAADDITHRLMTLLPGAAAYSAIALAVGVLGSLALGRRLKRRTFGLELDEIAALLREREAMLHGVREGVVTFDPSGRVTLLNDEARRLLRLTGTAIGSRLDALLPAGRLRDVLSGDVAGADETVLTDDFCLVVNRMAVTASGTDLGAVVTLRDRTEQEGLLRELDNVRGLTDALRAQQHEFSNRMHTLTGLLELGNVEGARSFVEHETGRAAGSSEMLEERLADPFAVALLRAKTVVAQERGVELVVTEGSSLDVPLADPDPMLTVLGNLIDNGLDAAGGGEPPRCVTVHVDGNEPDLVVRVTDTGPGIPPGTSLAVFADGFSTKTPSGRARRGLGLALVRRMVQRLGGSVDVTEGPGACFTVRLPLDAVTGTAAGAGRATAGTPGAGR